MTTITFDKLAYVDALKSGGFTAEQARAQASALEDALRDTVATRQDIIDLKKEMQIIKRDIVITLGGMIIGLGGVLIAIKFFT